jgi:hypothetical protein
VVGALAIAGPASASIEIAIGHDQRSGVYGGCGDASARCVYVQDSWDRDAYVIGPDRLPFMDGGAVTHLNMQLYTAAGTVVPRVVHVGHYDPATGANTYVVVGSGPPLTLTGTGQLDADVHLPVHKDDTLAFALSGGAQPFLDYDAGFGGRGYGNLFYGATDSDTELTGLKQVYDGDRVDGLVLRATLERDGDGDGFGDETQDPCPGRAGSADGCSATPPTTSTPPGSSGPRKPPALTDLSLHHRVLAYTVTRRARVSARLDRRVRHGWRLDRRVRLPSGLGRHHVRLPRTRHHATRAVVECRTLKDRLERRVVLAVRAG